jgi:hypothetical protein
VSKGDKKEDLKRLRFENGDIIPDVERYFADDEESDEESDKENENDEESEEDDEESRN